MSEEIAYCKIFPTIGIARVGNSLERDGFFIGPEGIAPPGPSDERRFTDAAGAVLRQAARFRVYGFDAKDAVIGEPLVQPAYDEFFRCPIGFGHQVHIALIFRDDAALEVATQEFAGLRSNIRCAGGKTKIKLRGEILQGTLLSTPLGRRLRSLMVRIWCL